MLMKQQQELKRKGAADLHRRVVLLIQIQNDSEFQAWCESEHVNYENEFDHELEDVGIDYVTLRSVFNSYPNVEDWERTNVRELVAQVVHRQSKSRQSTDRISWKDRAKELEMELKRVIEEKNELEHLLSAQKKMMIQYMQIPQSKADSLFTA
tara:strand:- start:2681 stop:3139 length:459 start_codon:yes stop_codon:yes gene_type:complete